MRILALSLLLAVGCTAAPTEPVASAAATSEDATSTTIEFYPDAQVRAHWSRLRARRPVPNSALPPRHLDEDAHPLALVERAAILPGGPPPDGIASIDAPRTTAWDAAELTDDEAVIVAEVEGVAHVYPVAILVWHEIVNDVVGGVPLTVTYCPLCNSAVAYDRRLDDRVLDFGTSGSLHQSALVMYDRQTESLWTHLDGRAVVGDLVGAELDLVPVVTLRAADARRRHPDARVLVAPEGSARPYGTNPYPGYDGAAEPLDVWLTEPVDDRRDPMTRIVGVRTETGSFVVERARVAREVAVVGDAGGTPVVVWWRDGLRSPLDASTVADGAVIGSVEAFVALGPDGTLDLRADDGVVRDGTGTVWEYGRAVRGPRAGTVLTRAEHLDTFWFAWSASDLGD